MVLVGAGGPDLDHGSADVWLDAEGAIERIRFELHGVDDPWRTDDRDASRFTLRLDLSYAEPEPATPHAGPDEVTDSDDLPALQVIGDPWYPSADCPAFTVPPTGSEGEPPTPEVDWECAEREQRIELDGVPFGEWKRHQFNDDPVTRHVRRRPGAAGDLPHGGDADRRPLIRDLTGRQPLATVLP